jgi:hypothetical protein
MPLESNILIDSTYFSIEKGVYKDQHNANYPSIQILTEPFEISTKQYP